MYGFQPANSANIPTRDACRTPPAISHTMPYRKWLHIHNVPRPNQEQTY